MALRNQTRKTCRRFIFPIANPYESCFHGFDRGTKSHGQTRCTSSLRRDEFALRGSCDHIVCGSNTLFCVWASMPIGYMIKRSDWNTSLILSFVNDWMQKRTTRKLIHMADLFRLSEQRTRDWHPPNSDCYLNLGLLYEPDDGLGVRSC